MYGKQLRLFVGLGVLFIPVVVAITVVQWLLLQGTDLFGSRLSAAPEVTLAFDSAASSRGALGFTGVLTGGLDFGTGALAASGQGDIFIVVVDPPSD